MPLGRCWSLPQILVEHSGNDLCPSGSSTDLSRNDDAGTQIKAIAARRDDRKPVDHKGLSLAPGGIAIFTNGFKEEPGVDPDAKRPSFNGYWNPGNGEKIVSIAIWERKRDSDGLVILGGETSYPLPGKAEGLEQAPERTLDDLVATGEVTRGPKRGKRNEQDRSMA